MAELFSLVNHSNLPRTSQNYLSMAPKKIRKDLVRAERRDEMPFQYHLYMDPCHDYLQLGEVEKMKSKTHRSLACGETT